MKKLVYLLLFVACSMAVVSCQSNLPDYENLSKEELTKLHNNGDVEATLQLGRLYIHEMNIDYAKSYFKEVAKKANPKGFHNLAIVNFAQGEIDEGIANLEKAIDLGFESSKGVLAWILVSNPNKGRYEEGLKLAEESASKGSKNGFSALVTNKIAQGHEHIAEGDEVDTNFKKAIEAGSSTCLVGYFICMENGGWPAEDIIEEIRIYQSKYPKLVGDIIAYCNGDKSSLNTPFYEQGFLLIEDMME